MQTKLKGFKEFECAVKTYESNVDRLAKQLHKPHTKQLLKRKPEKSVSIQLTITTRLKLNNCIELKHFQR